jgi:DNA modification methylase
MIDSGKLWEMLQWHGISVNGGQKRVTLRKIMRTITFLTEDACNLNLADNSVDLIITSPPYLTLDPERYGGDRKKQLNYNKNLKQMLKLLVKATKEMERILKPTGSIIINIGHNSDMPYHYVVEILKQTNLKMTTPPFIQHLNQKKDFLQKEKLWNDYDFWFHFTKNPLITYYNPFETKKYETIVWDIPWHKKDDFALEHLISLNIGHVLDSYNPDIAERFIKMFSKPGHTVLDIFGGSGTGAVTAWLNDRNAITNDISEQQTEIAKERFRFEQERVK